MKIEVKKESFLNVLQKLLDKTEKQTEISLREIFETLSGKGYAALLIIFSIPFSLPISIPGVSTPFGLILAFIGLRIAFAKKLWWPKWILDKKFSSTKISSVVTNTMKVFKKVHKILFPRLAYLVEAPALHRLHGIMVFFLAILLSLPIPLPFTNMLSALPILCIGLGLLEDDGLCIIIAYIIAAICFSFFTGITLITKHAAQNSLVKLFAH